MGVDLRETLIRFAEKNGLGSDRVDAFLSEMDDIRNLEDVLGLPDDLQYHASYFPGGSFTTFLKDNWPYVERHESVSLDEMIEALDSMLYQVYYNVRFDFMKITVDEIKLLEAPDLDDVELLEQVKDVMIYIIENRLGSCTFDW